MASSTVRRAAFDIGSGATKVMIADVAGSTVVEELFGLEVPVSFAVDWKKSANGELSEEIQAKGLESLRGLLAECDARNVPASARQAVATEVFRKAANGAAYLDKVRELGLPVRMLTQEEEADVGFKTAVALQDGPAESVICWDSGGASFQITSRAPDGALRSYLGALGTGVCTSILVEVVQFKQFAETPSPNPVKAEDAAVFLKELKERIPESPPWLCGSCVTAIGGSNSMFCIAFEVLGTKQYGVADVRRALDSVVGLTDEELAPMRMCQGDLREPAAYIIPKLCLLLAVMEHCGIETVNYCKAIGSCAGMLISEGFFVA